MAVKTKANGKHTRNELPVELIDRPGEDAGQAIVIPKPKIITLSVRIRGTAPLMICRMDEKTQDAIGSKMEGKAQNKKESKNFDAEYKAARYVSTEGWDGVNAVSFRAAMISAARNVEGLTMTALKQAVFVEADGYCPTGTPLIRILKAKAEKHTGPCRTTTGVTYLRARPLYRDWECVLRLRLNGSLLSAEAALNLLSHAGAWCGVGEWRPTANKSMTGQFGTWEIVSE